MIPDPSDFHCTDHTLSTSIFLPEFSFFLNCPFKMDSVLLIRPWMPFSVAFPSPRFASSALGLVFPVLRWIHQASFACLLRAAYAGLAKGKGGERRPSRLLANDQYRPSAISVSFPAGSASDFFKLCICCICMSASVCVRVCVAFLLVRPKIRIRFLFLAIQSLAATGRNWIALKEPVNDLLLCEPFPNVLLEIVFTEMLFRSTVTCLCFCFEQVQPFSSLCALFSLSLSSPCAFLTDVCPNASRAQVVYWAHIWFGCFISPFAQN